MEVSARRKHANLLDKCPILKRCWTIQGNLWSLSCRFIKAEAAGLHGRKRHRVSYECK
jgi:hypothetical protein